MTPTIYKIAYVESEDSKFILFQNDGNIDIEMSTFDSEVSLLQYLNSQFNRVGTIPDYDLYTRKITTYTKYD